MRGHLHGDAENEKEHGQVFSSTLGRHVGSRPCTRPVCRYHAENLLAAADGEPRSGASSTRVAKIAEEGAFPEIVFVREIAEVEEAHEAVP